MLIDKDEAKRNFAEWFGDSKVVDQHGRPLMVFHGTANPSWENDRIAFDSTNGMGEGAYFTPIATLAEEYASMDSEVEGDPPFLIPVYLAIRNPKIMENGYDSQSISPELKAELVALGHDGVFGVYGGELAEIAVFSPLQVKSIFNSGAWDTESPSITDAENQPQPDRPRPPKC